MQVRVTIRGSPYSAVAVGAVGTVVSRRYVETKIKQWHVRFSNGAEWTFYPDELEVLNGENQAALSAGNRR